VSSALEAVIVALIREQGPIPIARYMSLALAHPEHGYYHRREPFGAGGDFVTAPEISQMFGEIAALWLAQAWRDRGRPEPVRLVEIGPGRGTMMADMLRALRAVPELRAAAEIHLVEPSARLREAQRQRLAGEAITWYRDLQEVPHGPLLLVANEVIDALPVHQLVRTAAGWVERCVVLDAEGQLAFMTAGQPAPAALVAGLPDDAGPGAIAERSPAREALAEAIGRRLAADPGVALLIDYGAAPDGPAGDTLQAVRAQQPADPLAAPGEADLSAQVDFAALARAAARGGARAFGPVPQGAFLRALGIEARALALIRKAPPEERRAIRAALFRLTDASAMGELFKVLALASPEGPPPPGFAP
jgi:NADH dehydrogenase [ubiquinone] 1 alpha subcomplex assembly factor 7